MRATRLLFCPAARSVRRMSADAEARVCCVCGTSGARLLVCGLCDELRVANPARYCSSTCQRQGWVQHKRWHEQTRTIPASPDAACMAQRDQAAAERQAQMAEGVREEAAAPGNDTSAAVWAKLLAKAAQRMVDKDFKGASKSLKKAIQLEPQCASTYVNLAVCYALSNDGQRACEMYVKAIARAQPDSEEWGTIVARTFNSLSQPYCANVVKPSWWNDAELKTLSARVLAAVPTTNYAGDPTPPMCFALKMRAYVLCGAPDSEWRADIRSPEELLEAANLYKRAVDYTPGQEDKVQCLRNAANLTRQADGLNSAMRKVTMMLQAFGACGALCLAVSLCVIVSGVKIGGD